MASFAKPTRSEADVAREHRGPAREDFVAPGDHRSFAFAVDPAGRLAWESNEIGGDHVIAILCERVSDEHLAFLRARGVSYLLAGAREVDLPLALEKIGAVFGVKTLMLEGGGRINGGMLRAGLVDEASVLLAPHHELDPARFIAATSRTAHGYASFLATQLAERDIVILVAEGRDGVLGYAYAGLEGVDYMALRGPACCTTSSSIPATVVWGSGAAC